MSEHQHDLFAWGRKGLDQDPKPTKPAPPAPEPDPEPIAAATEFDDLIAWAEGADDTDEHVAIQVETAARVQAGAQLLADRINSKRMVSLLNALTAADQEVVERLPVMDPITLIAARRDLEASMQKTSDRLQPAPASAAGNQNGVNINLNQPALPSAPKPTVQGLDQSARMRVRQLVAKTVAASKESVVECEIVEKP